MRIPAIIAGVAAITAAHVAQAADLGTGQNWGNQNSGYAPAQQVTWTGVYAGGHVGTGWGHASAANTSGFVVGAHAGYNQQFNQVVAGVEADVDASGINHSGFGDKFNQRWLGSARARLGYAFDRFMVYGTGGLAMGSTQFKDAGTKSSNTRTGYALGVGAEMKFTQNVSVRAEYLHYGLGSDNYQSLKGPINIDSTTNVIRAGASYHF